MSNTCCNTCKLQLHLPRINDEIWRWKRLDLSKIIYFILSSYIHTYYSNIPIVPIVLSYTAKQDLGSVCTVIVVHPLHFSFLFLPDTSLERTLRHVIVKLMVTMLETYTFLLLLVQFLLCLQLSSSLWWMFSLLFLSPALWTSPDLVEKIMWYNKTQYTQLQ